MKYYDIHTHVQFSAFDADRGDVLRRAREARIGMINVGTQADTSRAALAIANPNDNIFAAIGLHPIHTSKSYHDTQELGEGGKDFTSRGEVFDYDTYKDLANDPRVVAIGECGLDYYRCSPDSALRQKEIFASHIALAKEVRKPLMLHIRNAYEDALAILRSGETVHGNVHFFAGNWEIARQFLDLGCTLSFTGVITFSREYDEVIRNVPLDMLHAETDAPYVAPAPYRGKRNEPVLVVEIIRRIADIKRMSFDDVSAQLAKNARRVFGFGS